MSSDVMVEMSTDTPFVRPKLRGHLHTWTALFAVPAGVLLVLAANRAAARVGASIYAASVLALFATSASYHRLAHSVRARQVMRRLDHSMIFVLIAGTYTPVCLLALPLAWGIPILSIVWAGALLGIVLKTTAFDRFRALHHSLYPILGWVAIGALPILYQRLSTVQFAFLIAGGVIYTVGIPVLIRKRPDPWPTTFGYHEVWHAFTVAAAACHFVVVGMLVSAA
jgi:hemolysin III